VASNTSPREHTELSGGRDAARRGEVEAAAAIVERALAAINDVGLLAEDGDPATAR
jgi:hypothetical protein